MLRFQGTIEKLEPKLEGENKVQKRNKEEERQKIEDHPEGVEQDLWFDSTTRY